MLKDTSLALTKEIFVHNKAKHKVKLYFSQALWEKLSEKDTKKIKNSDNHNYVTGKGGATKTKFMFFKFNKNGDARLVGRQSKENKSVFVFDELSDHKPNSIYSNIKKM